jgi:hypothetical protein
VLLWEARWVASIYGPIHAVAWLLLYGMNLMLDLPDMVGFTQVRILVLGI